MRVLVRERGIELTEDNRAQIARTLGFALDRFWSRIRAVTVGLADLNGPRGGVDKRCRLEVALEPSGTVFVEATDPDVLAAVHVAAKRMGEAVSRKVKRDREVSGRAGASVHQPRSGVVSADQVRQH